MEQTVGSSDVLDSYWVSPMLACRGIRVDQILHCGDLLDAIGILSS